VYLGSVVVPVAAGVDVIGDNVYEFEVVASNDVSDVEYNEVVGRSSDILYVVRVGGNGIGHHGA